MSFAIPTLQDLVERSRAAFRTYLPGTDAWLWPNNINPTAKVIGGAMYELHRRLDYVQRQKFASTAEGEWLDRHAMEIGLSRKPAAAASGSVTFTATTAITVAAGAIMTRSDGVQIKTTEAGALGAPGTLTLGAAAVDAGSTGTTVAGTPLTILSGVTGTATVVASTEGIGGGGDLESDEALRTRILFRKRFPPHGGSAPDYVEWVTSLPSVTRVFIERLWNGAGTIRVFPLTDGATANGIPTAATLAAVEGLLGGVTPAGAVVTVAAPTPVTINVVVQDITPDTAAVREAVIRELQDAFLRLGRVSGNDTLHPSMPFLATSVAFSRSWIWQAVANATGEQSHIVVEPAFDVPIPAGSMPVLGTVTFTT